MPTTTSVFRAALLLAGSGGGSAQVSDPRITRWRPAQAAQYTRIYETSADKTRRCRAGRRTRGRARGAPLRSGNAANYSGPTIM